MSIAYGFLSALCLGIAFDKWSIGCAAMFGYLFLYELSADVANTVIRHLRSIPQPAPSSTIIVRSGKDKP
jgi:hypothetical protein